MLITLSRATWSRVADRLVVERYDEQGIGGWVPVEAELYDKIVGRTVASHDRQVMVNLTRLELELVLTVLADRPERGRLIEEGQER